MQDENDDDASVRGSEAASEATTQADASLQLPWGQATKRATKLVQLAQVLGCVKIFLALFWGKLACVGRAMT